MKGCEKSDQNPGTPGNGETPDKGETPQTPEKPDQGQTPNTPDNGTTPDKGQTPETPDNGTTPDKGQTDKPTTPANGGQSNTNQPGGKLPKTATNYPMAMALGSSLFLAGAGLYFFRRRPTV